MTTIKINDTYRVEIHNYDFVLIKHGKKHDITPVSYTHLTLPTNSRV